MGRKGTGRVRGPGSFNLLAGVGALRPWGWFGRSQGAQGTERDRRAGLGWTRRDPCPGQWLWPRMAGGRGQLFPSARRDGGREGLGRAGPRWARRPNTRNRLFPAMGAEGAGAGPGQGAPGDPSLVFSERLNRNLLADGWLPPRADLQDPGPRPEWAPGPASSLLLGGPAATHPLHRAPHGGMKVQTGRGRHGGGVLQDVRHWRGRGVPRTRPRAAPGGGVPSLAGGARRWGGWGA